MKLIKILSDKVQIRTNQNEFKDVTINDLLTIADSKAKLVVIVTSLTDSEPELHIDDDDFIGVSSSMTTIECSIIGCIKGGLFVKAIDEYPTTNVTAAVISPGDFQKMLGKYRKSGFEVGVYASYKCRAYVDGNKIFQRHSCVVGNTGSGKSETLAKILEEASALPGTNIIVFDIHGEYGKLSYSRNIKIGRDFHFPVWMFGFSDMVINILKLKEETSSVIMSAMRKCYYKLCPDGKENRPVYFDYESFIREMRLLNEEEIPTGDIYKTGNKAGKPRTAKGDYNGKLTSAINILEDKRADSRYSFLFTSEPQQYVNDVMGLIMNNDKPVKNIDLSEIPHDVAITIIGVITKLIYEVQRTFSCDTLCPITIVCDEAHVYIPNNFQLSASEKRMVEIFEDIAKEGRKFGITLMVASQRPSELNKTIMAQCANYIVAKLNNENDKSMIKGMIPDGEDGIIDSITMFNPGEVIIIGDCVPIPMKIKVSLAKERPQSRTIDFWDRWCTKNKNDYSIKLQ